MRTTLTLDDDVAIELERLRRLRGGGLKEVVNDVLRRGLSDLQSRPKRSGLFQTTSVSLGSVRLASIDNVAETLAIAEGEAFK
jgi:hypothetical protein